MTESWRAVVSTLFALGLAGCGRPGPAALPLPQLSLEEALARVDQSLPASRHVDNDLLPSDQATALVGGTPPVKLCVGLTWVFNDEISPWFVGIEKGFYREAGLELVLVPGGSGIDPLALLAGGQLDIAVPPAGTTLVELIASPTPVDLVAIGAVLKGSPYCWLGIDKSTPRDQVSAKKLQPGDFIGKTIGLQAGGDALLNFVTHEYHVPPDGLHEWFSAREGLGCLLVQAVTEYRADRLYAVTLIAGLLSIGSYLLCRGVERWMFRWQAY